MECFFPFSCVISSGVSTALNMAMRENSHTVSAGSSNDENRTRKINKKIRLGSNNIKVSFGCRLLIEQITY